VYEVQSSTFEEILPIWRAFLWPERKSAIRPQSSMTLDSGVDLEIYKNKTYFFKILVEGSVVGVNSVFATGDGIFRSRGLFVSEAYRQRGVGKQLLSTVIDCATKSGGHLIWSLPRESALATYQSVGFEILKKAEATSVEFGPNFYVTKNL
jgi:GNAT superfamily N-acetyltransferase